MDSTTVIKREPTPTPKADAPKFAEMGVTGLKCFSGILNEEFLRELQGDKGRKIFREMSQNDATVGAVLYAIGLLIRGVKWRAEPKDESAKAIAEGEFIESIFADMSHTWEDLMSEVLSMLPYGWQYSEVVYKKRMGPEQDDPSKRSEYDDGRIGIRKIAPRAQDTLSRWEMQDDGGISGMWQVPPISGGEVMIPVERALLFRTTARLNSPEGVSILRTAYESWYFLKRIREYEAIGIERELAGLPIVRIPSQYTKADASTAEQALYAQFKQIARDLKFNEQGGLVLPSDFYKDKDGFPIAGARQVDVELLKSAGTRTINTTEVKNDYKRDITRAVLADFLMLGQDKGAFNLGESKTNLFLMAIEAILDQIAAPINRFAIPRLWAINGLPRETMPKYVPAKVTKEDLAKLGAFLQQASAAGMPLFPDEKLEAYVRSQADLPEKSPEALAMQEEERQRALDAEDAALEAQTAAAEAGVPPGGKGPPGKPPAGGAAKPGKAPPGGGKRPPPFGAKKYVIADKFNPNHDERGRFSETTGAGAADDPGHPEHQQWAREFQTYASQNAFGVDTVSTSAVRAHMHERNPLVRDAARAVAHAQHEVASYEMADPRQGYVKTPDDVRERLDNARIDLRAAERAARAAVGFDRKGSVWRRTKFNPNHDPASGQFTTGPGGGSGFADVTPEGFVAARDRSVRSAFLSPSGGAELEDHTLRLAHGGTVGYALSGDGDLQNVFNNGGPKGAGGAALTDAIKNGATTLDCYDGFLPMLYSKYGFEPVGRMTFSDDHAPAGWDYTKYGRPDVVFMAYRGGARDTIEDRVGSFKPYKPGGGERFEDWDAAKRASRTAVVAKWLDAGGARLPSGDAEQRRDRILHRELGDLSRRLGAHPEFLKSYDESLHPRDDQGQWTAGASGAFEAVPGQGEMYGEDDLGRAPEDKRVNLNWDQLNVEIDDDAMAILGDDQDGEFTPVTPYEFRQGMVGDFEGKMRVAAGSRGNVNLSIDLEENGVRIGRMERTVNFDMGYAEHTYLDLSKRGVGIAKELLSHQIGFYESVGISRVTLTANIDVGGYAWAKYGFVPHEGEEWDNLKVRVKDNADFLEATKRRAVEKILDEDDPRSVWAISDLPDGKKLLAGLEWKGDLELDDRDSMKRFRAYVGKRRKK